MTGTIFMETLRRNWRTALFWGIGMGWVGWLQIIILPDVDSLQQMAELMESLPPAMTQMFGGGDAAFMATPEGYLSLRFFSIVPLFLSFFAVTAGLNVTANEEDQGIMDMVLSLPVPRWRVVLERFLTFCLLICVILVLSVAGLWLGTQMSTLFQVSVSTLLSATFGVLPLLLAVLGFTILAAALLRRRGQAMALAFAFVIGAYFLDTLGAAATGTILYDLRALSVFSYYDGAQAVTGAMDWNSILVLVVVTVVFAAAGIWFFQRRDIGT